MAIYLAGENLTADRLNAGTLKEPLESSVDNATGTTTSTAFTSSLSGGASTLTLPFTAPASGAIMVIVSAECNNSTTQYAVASFAISGNAGTQSGADGRGVYSNGTSAKRASAVSIVTGLNPGQTGTITMVHRVSGGTGTFNVRKLGVVPL